MGQNLLTLRRLVREPELHAALSAGARERSHEFSWRRIAAFVLESGRRRRGA